MRKDELLTDLLTSFIKMLNNKGPNNGFITFRTNGLLHLADQNLLHLGPLLHLVPNPYHI